MTTSNTLEQYVKGVLAPRFQNTDMLLSFLNNALTTLSANGIGVGS